MIAYYLQNSSVDLNRLCNLSSLEQCFYIASMIFFKKEENNDKFNMAIFSNPFIDGEAKKKYYIRE